MNHFLMMPICVRYPGAPASTSLDSATNEIVGKKNDQV